MKSILVTGIGGGVGQGILRNLRAMALDTPIIGTNVTRVSAGNHLCDAVFQVPYAFDPGYVDEVAGLVRQHDVGLILPSTDYEAHYLALHHDQIDATVAASPAEVSAFCLDKYTNFATFERHGIEFARSFLPSEYTGQFRRVVVKPREGRGSRDVYVDPMVPTDFSDDYVVQEYLDGPELTTAFYVLQNGELHGSITFRRELEHGNTVSCEVDFENNAKIRELLNKIVGAFPFRGSCNIQSRVTERGIVPFEINCRISGTNSIRSQLGFPDVAYAVQELFLHSAPDQPDVRAGSAVRIMHDVIYPGIRLSEITDRTNDFWTY